MKCIHSRVSKTLIQQFFTRIFLAVQRDCKRLLERTCSTELPYLRKQDALPETNLYNHFLTYPDIEIIFTAMIPDYILQDRDSRLRVALGYANKTVELMLGREANRAGLSGTQYQVLGILFHLGPCSVNNIIEALLSSSGNIDVVFNNLQKNGFISKTVDEHDKRKRRIEITDKGRDIIMAAAPRYLATLHDHFEKLSDEEKETLIVLLNKISGAQDTSKSNQ